MKIIATNSNCNCEVKLLKLKANYNRVGFDGRDDEIVIAR